MNPEDCIPGWAEVMAAAQELKTQRIAGQDFDRVPYGGEVPDALPRCRDCAVERGQLHVPLCCVERCARCGAQAISCDCHDAAPVAPAVH